MIMGATRISPPPPWKGWTPRKFAYDIMFQLIEACQQFGGKFSLLQGQRINETSTKHSLLVWHTLWLWRWRRNVSLNMTSQKIVFLIVTAMRTSNLITFKLFKNIFMVSPKLWVHILNWNIDGTTFHHHSNVLY